MKTLPTVLFAVSKSYAQSPTCKTVSKAPERASAISEAMHRSFAAPKSPYTTKLSGPDTTGATLNTVELETEGTPTK